MKKKNQQTTKLPSMQHYNFFFQAPENTVRYQIIGDGNAPTYFYINPVDGVITLLQSVEFTQTSFYRVSLLLYTVIP